MKPTALKTFLLAQFAIFLFVPWLLAAEATGKVCVEAISRGDDWQANQTGATEASVFKVQLDDQPAVLISTNASGLFTNLSLTAKHTVKIRLNDKPLTSFHFSFQDDHSDHQRLWYNTFYGTWSLTPVTSGQKCACPRSPARNPDHK